MTPTTEIATHETPLPILKQTPVKALSFTKRLGFRQALNARVEAFFAATGLPRRDVPQMYAKAVLHLVAYGLIYAAILWLGGRVHPLGVWAMYALWGFVIAGIGFNVMHDAIHGGFSDRPWINRVLGFSSELLGVSSFVWRHKHNVWHHTYTNIAGLDEDLETQGMLRMSPHEPWKLRFRWQHWYSPLVYALTGFSFLLRDFRVFFTGRSSPWHVYPKMNVKERFIFMVGKAMFFSISLVLPLVMMPWWVALIGWLVMLIVVSLILASIFQLAHVMEHAEFPEPEGDPLHIANEWAIHEVETTVNFAPRNRFLNFYAGGLNYQIEHHLFPHISHVHYPKIAPIVRAVCAEFGVKYHSYPRWRAALLAHWRTLRALGRSPDAIVTAPPLWSPSVE
ncbi:MAG: acyl-CoA desaturase [Anaerolineae bacterium]|nr:acyl-CoA desaturase [Thermoflexales bacterium]MDW8053120.1 acyl-CoA desaturase [Anaerolineae bacterium]